MAVTVVEEKRRVRCPKCTALNEYGNDDIGLQLRSNGSVFFAYVVCGRCGFSIDVASSPASQFERVAPT